MLDKGLTQRKMLPVMPTFCLVWSIGLALNDMKTEEVIRIPLKEVM